MRDTRKPIRVCAITGSRADYGLLFWTLRRLRDDDRFELQLLVTGMHLDRGSGLTWKAIVGDGFQITDRVPILSRGDRDIDIARSLARGTDRLAGVLHDLSPDVVLLLGDRFEILAAASACLPLRIPVAHVHGGESTLGSMDDQIRHAVTKLSHLHFVSTDLYGRRVRRMGEDPWRVHVVGAAGLEYIRKLRSMSREELSRMLDLDWNSPVFLFTYHPVTLQVERSERDLEEVLAAVRAVPGQWVVTGSNADTGGRALWRRVRELAKSSDVRVVNNLGQRAYLSMMKWATAIVGNSSSAIIEAPSFGLPAVNIGDRQRNRIRGVNVIDVPPDRHRIKRAIGRACSPAFRQRAREAPNPYDKGNASGRIVKVLARLPEASKLIEKRFYDGGRDSRWRG